MNLLSLARAIKIEELMSNCEFGLVGDPDNRGIKRQSMRLKPFLHLRKRTGSWSVFAFRSAQLTLEWFFSVIWHAYD